MAYKDKEKQKEFQRNWIKAKRTKLLENKKCANCDSTEDLNIVNIKGKNKKFSYSYSESKLQEKLKEAIILCETHYMQYNKTTKTKLSTTHGQSSRTRTYTSWVSMNYRCNNPNADNYQWYGELGVKVCERWKNFENFFMDMEERPYGMTLDRKNAYGNYEPNNCRWATAIEQGRNKRKSIGKV